MGIIPKKNGEPRQVIDLRAVNKVTKAQTHTVESPFVQASRVPPKTWKTCSDAWNGYHSVPLDPESRHLTTFNTPFGRFWYKCTPQGQKISGDAYGIRYDQILEDYERKQKIVDDCCSFDVHLLDYWFHVCEFVNFNKNFNSIEGR